MKTWHKVALALGCSVGIGVGIGSGFAIAGQPHMEAALGDLQTAQTELNAATADKGGYRVKALADVAQAIADVNAGIAYAAK